MSTVEIIESVPEGIYKASVQAVFLHVNTSTSAGKAGNRLDVLYEIDNGPTVKGAVFFNPSVVRGSEPVTVLIRLLRASGYSDLDFQKLVGMRFQIRVVHRPGADGRVFENVTSFIPLTAEQSTSYNEDSDLQTEDSSDEDMSQESSFRSQQVNTAGLRVPRERPIVTNPLKKKTAKF